MHFQVQRLGAWLCQILGTLLEKNPQGWGNTRTLQYTISKVPTSDRGPPLGEADDKRINKNGNLIKQKALHCTLSLAHSFLLEKIGASARVENQLDPPC